MFFLRLLKFFDFFKNLRFCTNFVDLWVYYIKNFVFLRFMRFGKLLGRYMNICVNLINYVSVYYIKFVYVSKDISEIIFRFYLVINFFN